MPSELKSDIIAVQEVSITQILADGTSYCKQLNLIIDRLGPGWKFYLQRVDKIPENHDNFFVAFMWNSARVKRLDVFPMGLPN